ncbi:MAG: hypothetical protein KGL31_13175 [candidate division NC10 bacterium]|nr:hypothetical protein [candidate division NC10 bacterium]MDE2322841.1 hypothetical protein [candidate division NC10 bacterium]
MRTFMPMAVLPAYAVLVRKASPGSAAIRYRQVLTHFPRKQLLVLGDIMVDEYIWGSVSRLSPEAPVPVVEVKAESFRLGGAGIVAAGTDPFQPANRLSLAVQPFQFTP